MVSKADPIAYLRMDEQDYEKLHIAFQTLAGRIMKPPLGDAQL